MSIRAQEVVAPTSVEELFGKLVQLQEANLGVARQIAETQLRASDAIEVAIKEAGITDPALLQLSQTFIDNGRTLAAVVLSPMALQNVSAGETLKRLLRRNIVLLEGARTQARANADLAGAFEKYAVLQAQSEDLLVAFANGWTRYGEVIRTAEIAGMIRPGSFDATDARWSLANPQGQPAAVAAVEEPPALPTPEPALTGNPVPKPEAEPTPQPELVTEVAVATPAPVTPAPATAAEPNRLDATGPLALAEIKADGSGRIGDWIVETDGPDLFTATSANTNPETRDRIAGMRIACGENGTLYYQIDASTDYASYVAYSDDSLTRPVSAESNIISGPDSTALADTLRLGFEWANREPGQRQLTIAAVDDDEEIKAQFSPSGYMEARGKVLDACVAGIVAKAMGTGTETAEEPAASPVATGELPKGAVIKPDLVAPIPKTRPKTFKTQGPVDIMAGT